MECHLCLTLQDDTYDLRRQHNELEYTRLPRFERWGLLTETKKMKINICPGLVKYNTKDVKVNLLAIDTTSKYLHCAQINVPVRAEKEE